MRRNSIFIVSAILGFLSGPQQVPASTDDVLACNAADHYTNAEADYFTCDRALKRPGLSAKERATLLTGRAESAYFLNRMDLAVPDLDAAISSDPKYGEAYLRRGWTRLHLNQFDGALQDFTTLLDMEPDSPKALFAIGFTYIHSGEWKNKTLPAYNRALEISPNDHLTRYNLARIYCCLENRADLAMVEYDRILHAPDAELAKVKMWKEPGRKAFDFKGLVRFSRITNLIVVRDYVSAMEATNGMIADYPDFAVVYSTRAYLFMTKNKYSEALADAQKALKLNPNGEDEKKQIVDALYQLKRYEEGFKAVDSYLEQPLSQEIRSRMLMLRGLYNKQLHHPEQALFDLEDSFSMDPQNLQSMLIQLIQHGYYDGHESDPYSDKIRNSLQACLIDPVCAS